MKNIGIALIFTLSCTGLYVANIAGINISVFLVTAVIALPIFAALWLFSWWRLNLFGLQALAVYLFLNFLLFAHSAKFTSVIYSVMFMVVFLVIMNSWRFIAKETFVAILKAVLFAYALNVLVAQVLMATGVDSPFLGSLFGRLGDAPFERYIGLSSEPSYAGFVVMTSFFVLYNLIKVTKRQLLVYGGLILYLTVSFDSIYTYLLGSVVLAVIARQRWARWSVLVLPPLLLFVGLASYFHAIPSQEGRLMRILVGLINGDAASLFSIARLDHSAFMRIAPLFQYFDSIKLTDYSFYIGHGAMASHEFFVNSLYSHLNPATTHIFNPGLIGFFYDYGVIGGGLVLVWVWKTIRSPILSVPSLFITLMFLNASFNTQLFWYMIIVFAIAERYSYKPFDSMQKKGIPNR